MKSSLKKAAVFLGCFTAAYIVVAILGAGVPGLYLLMGVAVFFGVIAFFISEPIYLPSAVVSGSIILFVLGGAIAYPRILALRAQSPEEHLEAARALSATWRYPFCDEAQAWQHFLAAAEGGNPEAEFAVGSAYRNGHYHISVDREKGRQFLQAAASQGNTDAKNELASSTIP